MTTVSDRPPRATKAPPPGPQTPAHGNLLRQGLQLPLLSGLQLAVQMGVALVSARWLGPGDRGDYVLATTLSTLLLLLSSMGAGGASRVLLAERDRWWTWSRYVRLAAVLTGPHLLVTATFGLAGLTLLASGGSALFVPFLAFSVTALPAHLLREGLHGLGRHRSSLTIDVANAAGQLVLIAAAYRLGILTPAVALYIGALCYAGCVAAQILVGRSADAQVASRPRASARTWWREAAGFLRVSRFALLAALGQSFVVIGDRLVLGAAGTPADVGIYAAASSLAQLTWVAPMALTTLLTRRTAEAQSLDAWRQMHRPVLVLTAALAVVVSVAGWFAIPILLGEEFEAGRSVLPILCLAGIPYASYHFDSAACAGLRDLRTGGVGALQGCLTLLAATAVGWAVLGMPGIACGVLLTYVGMAVATRMRMPGGRLSRVPAADATATTTRRPAGPSPVPAADAARVVPLREWDPTLARLGVDDTYLRAAYHRASAVLEPAGTEPVLLHVQQGHGEIALPLLLRPLPGGTGWDATGAYGYGGPVAAGSPDVVAFGESIDRWALQRGVVATFLRLHPLIGNAHLVPPTADLVQAGATVAWDVSVGRDLAAGMHAHHRRAARTANRSGLVTTVARPTSLRRFRELYIATMRRQRADPYFYFPDPYWTCLLEDAATLEPVLVEGRLGGRTVAALLCFRNGSRLHYHLGATDNAARSIGASHRCFLAAAEWAQSEGMSVFHLGGGVGGSTSSSLFEFKRRFDPDAEPLPFHVAKLVHDPQRYRELSGGTSTEGFFPPWRRPS